MKIAIHQLEGESEGFSAGWVKSCNDLGIEIIFVNALDSNIIEEVSGCDGFMWHWNPSCAQMARQVIASLEAIGVRTFPNINTCWHFDDKVGQKYLFEALCIPTPMSWVFYDEDEALEWARHASYPKVFKLRGGAGAINVKLVKSCYDANRLIRRMFGKGFPQASEFADLSVKIRKHNRNRDWKRVFTKTLPRVMWSLMKRSQLHIERGYVYFQEFIPDNSFDIRVVVIGNKAFAIRRNCRPNDFRASGSGEIIYDKSEIPLECIQIAFGAAQKMKMQCAAFDFVKSNDGNFLIVEASYGFSPRAYDKCEGYWTPDLEWHDETIAFERWHVEEIVKSIIQG